jgi:glycosyltransferase involved in cell wall biosynthesis
MSKPRFYVVIPIFNEEKAIRDTLDSLLAQSDTDFTLVLVDNASTDQTVAVIEQWRREHPALAVDLIREPQKGTGTAADTGFRYAIAQGATHIARTDADCLPIRDWVAGLKRAFAEEGLEFVVGVLKARTDEISLDWSDRFVIPLLMTVAETYGKLTRRDKRFKYPYILVAGSNLAITADLYLRCGGFPHTRTEEEHEDRILSERVRALTRRVGKKRHLVVYSSVRRAKRYGYRNTLLWYWDHKYQPEEVDIR